MPRAVLLALLIAVSRTAAIAQTPTEDAVAPVTLHAAATLYGDNTEASNPFRRGETLFGSVAAVTLSARVSPRVALKGGALGHQRFGSDRSFDEARPIIAVVIGGPASRLVFGTLETMRRVDGSGPDRTGPHDLLPPIQRETLAFDRPWEAGLQWIVETRGLKQDAWVHWERRAVEGRRERFNAGVRSRYRLRQAIAVRSDVHLVHQGGQVPAAEPVADSTAAALGIEAGAPVGRADRVSLEALALVSRYVPNRGQPADARTGFGTFVRLAVEERDWRIHGILWRAQDFIKAEGDPHYHSLRRDGTQHAGVRDYAEAGLTRLFKFDSRSWLEASARWHRVENDYEYSFRVTVVAAGSWKLRGAGAGTGAD